MLHRPQDNQGESDHLHNWQIKTTRWDKAGKGPLWERFSLNTVSSGDLIVVIGNVVYTWKLRE